MNFTVYSQMMNAMTPSSPRPLHRVVLCRTLRGVAWLVLPFCYLGVLLAPTVVLSIPFQVLHSRAVSSVVFWSTTTAMNALVLWLFHRSARTAFSAWRQRVIQVEAIVLCMALVLAVLLIEWVFPPR